MKRILFILLLCLSSCCKTYIYDRIREEASFYDKCQPEDSVYYNTSCNIFKEYSEMYLFRREINTLDTTVFVHDKHIYVYYKDTVLTNKEYHKYSNSEFKSLIENKLKEKDEKNLINFYDNFYCNYETIEKIHQFLQTE